MKKMIKKLILIFSFITLVTIAFSETTYAAQEGEKIVVSDELIKLNNLYKEGIITEEEFSKAKSILLNLNPDSNESYITEIEKTTTKKQDLEKQLKKARTAAERKRIKEQSEKRLIAAKKAKKERIKEEKELKKQARLEERERICEEDPRNKACRTTMFGYLKGIKTGITEKEAEKRKAKEREKELKIQARLEEKERIKAKIEKRKAEKQMRKEDKSTIFKTLKKIF